ncbi:hypothetical protein Taro_047310 [Colocasia esculenta]|uniref:Uncharacterized protein n=1 Tax=Colocasia esculenta TaxID=4460 RepID=A0A843X5A6_COLES|nr:hypothetical protein [Colocasia esculenta]
MCAEGRDSLSQEFVVGRSWWRFVASCVASSVSCERESSLYRELRVAFSQVLGFWPNDPLASTFVDANPKSATTSMDANPRRRPVMLTLRSQICCVFRSGNVAPCFGNRPPTCTGADISTSSEEIVRSDSKLE